MKPNPFAVAGDLHARRRVDTSVTSVRSAAQLPAAMNALASAADVRRDVAKALAGPRELLSQAEDEALEVDLRGKAVDLKEFEEQLRSHVIAFCNGKGSKNFPDGLRTRKFGRGTILVRQGVERIESVHGHTDAVVNAAMLARVKEMFDEALEAVGLTGLVRYSVELDRRAAAKAGPEQLAEVGLRLGRAPDTVTITV